MCPASCMAAVLVVAFSCMCTQLICARCASLVQPIITHESHQYDCHCIVFPLAFLAPSPKFYLMIWQSVAGHVSAHVQRGWCTPIPYGCWTQHPPQTRPSAAWRPRVCTTTRGSGSDTPQRVRVDVHAALNPTPRRFIAVKCT